MSGVKLRRTCSHFHTNPKRKRGFAAFFTLLAGASGWCTAPAYQVRRSFTVGASQITAAKSFTSTMRRGAARAPATAPKQKRRARGAFVQERAARGVRPRAGGAPGLQRAADGRPTESRTSSRTLDATNVSPAAPPEALRTLRRTLPPRGLQRRRGGEADAARTTQARTLTPRPLGRTGRRARRTARHARENNGERFARGPKKSGARVLDFVHARATLKGTFACPRAHF